jgi:hypothetical protein
MPMIDNDYHRWSRALTGTRIGEMVTAIGTKWL